VAVGLAFFGVATRTGLGLLFGDAVCSGVALHVVVPLKRSGNASVANLQCSSSSLAFSCSSPVVFSS